MQLPTLEAQPGSDAAGASGVSGDNSLCVLLAQHRAWAHEDDAPARPTTLPGVAAEREACQEPAASGAGAPVPPASTQWTAHMPTNTAGLSAAAPQGQLAAQAAKLQHLQCCYGQLQGMLMLVNDVSASALLLV